MKILFAQRMFGQLAAQLRRVGRWWLKEFLDLFPEWIAEILVGRRMTSLVIAGEGQTGRLELLDSAGRLIVSEDGLSGNALLPQVDRFLAARRLTRTDVDLGLRLAKDSVFCRRVLLPAEAIGTVDVIIAQDLARKTPFKSEDIYSDHVVVEGVQKGKVIVWQWITRRMFVDQTVRTLGLGIDHVAFVLFDHVATDHPMPCINLRRGKVGREVWWGRTVFALSCSAIVVGLLAGGLKYRNQQRELDRLAAEVATTGKKAQQVRAMVDQLQDQKNALLRLRLLRNEAPGLIDLWWETTRVLPSHSWLTEFRLNEIAGKREGQVTLIGFSSAAPSLVGVIDGSPRFFDAGLTAPISFDASEGRERFVLQAKVKMPDSLKEASR